MDCRQSDIMREWIKEVEEAGARAVSAMESKPDIDRVAGHLNGRASFALAFARRAVDDVADYLTDWSGTAEGSREQAVCESLQRADQELVVAQVDQSTDVLREAFNRAALKAPTARVE
jgi:hypothetical protein